MNGQAFLGCKINLISRAGIRYEGILYTIDANNSTVALSKVKSFGTEDRYAETPVSPRDEVYEYIIFRGSDIQDLHVCEAPKKQPQIMSQDPAILEITGKPPISAPYSRRRVQFTPRSYQGDDRQIPYIDDIRPSTYYQGYNDEEIHDPWPERIPSRPYYSRNRSYYPNVNYEMRNPQMFYPEMPRYSAYRRRTGFSGPNRNLKDLSIPDQPARKNATLRRNTRRSSSLNIRSTGQKPISECVQEISRTSSGNSRSTNMSGRPESQNGPEYKYEKEYDFETANAEIAKELERLTLEKNSVSTTTLLETQNANRENKDKGATGDSEGLESNFVLNCDSSTMMNGRVDGSAEMLDSLLTTNASLPSDNEGLSNGPSVGAIMTKDDGDNNVINYDRAKCFYDNISSEATDRARGKMIRAINWRDERKLNVETFGFSSEAVSGNNRPGLRRNIVDSINTINASNSASNRISISTSSSFYKQDMMRYNTAPGSYYHVPYYQPYYQPRWFSRRPEYHRVPAFVQAWN